MLLLETKPFKFQVDTGLGILAKTHKNIEIYGIIGSGVYQKGTFSSDVQVWYPTVDAFIALFANRVPTDCQQIANRLPTDCQQIALFANRLPTKATVQIYRYVKKTEIQPK